jgi:hypothetical protein
MVHYLAAALVAAASAVATTGKPQWQSDYGKALAATRSVQRPLLVVLDIPSNPQARINGSLLSAEGQQAKLLESYELCHVDVSTEYGQRVAKAFRATQFPHTAIIDRKGAVVLFKKPGQMAESEWSATLAKYQTGERSLATSQTAYFRGNSILPSSYPVMTNSSYCPSCQRRAMGM